MKSRLYFVFGVLLAMLSWNHAWAEPLTVSVTARVTSVTDAGNILGSSVVPGALFTGHYIYDTSAVGQSTGSPNQVAYYQLGSMASVRLALGSLVFETGIPSPTWGNVVRVQAYDPGRGYDQIYIFYNRTNRPLSNGAVVDVVEFTFNDASSTALQTTDLPTTAPVLSSYTQSQAMVFGTLNGNYFQLWLTVESAQTVPPQRIEVTPGASNFLTQQRFDAALLLPAGTTVVSAQASAYGIALPLSYPGTCQLETPTTSGRPVILCPDAHTALATAPTATQVEWTVQLSDGTVLNKVVEWKLIQ